MKTSKIFILVLFISINGLFSQHQNVIIGDPLGYAYPTEPSDIPIATMVSSPNPFTESLFISFILQQETVISLQLFDMTGQKIEDVLDSFKYPKGKHVVKVDAIKLGIKSGIYFVRLNAGNTYVTSQIVCVENH